MKRFVLASVCLLMAIVVYPRVFSFVYRYVPSQWWTERIAYGQVRDPFHPRHEDYQAVQKFLNSGKRPKLLQEMEKKMRHFCLIGQTESETPQMGEIGVNCSQDDKENCLLVYASFNKSYPEQLRKLIDVVKKSDFKGHILYRIGGWPNVEEGDLKLAHVPFAYKPCFFREAQRLGYRRALWLDPSILPVVSLNQIFEKIGSIGYFALENGHTLADMINAKTAAALQTTLAECENIPSCSADVFGIDFSNEKAAQAFSKWYGAAQQAEAFFASSSDQCTLSVILHQNGLLQRESGAVVRHKDEPLSDQTLFQIARGTLQYGK